MKRWRNEDIDPNWGREYMKVWARGELNECGFKRKYSQEGAMLVANRMRAQGNAAISHYQCGFCRQWHVGNSKKARAMDQTKDYELVISTPNPDQVGLNAGTYVYQETGLRGSSVEVETGRFYIPFSSKENAVDCLRILIRQLERSE